MSITLYINLNQYGSGTTLSLNSDPTNVCVSATFTLVSGGVLNLLGNNDIDIDVTSNEVIVEFNGVCDSPYHILGQLYEDGQPCTSITFEVNTSQCDILTSPAVSYDCETGLDFGVVSIGSYIPNIPENTLLAPGDYIVTFLVVNNNSSNGCYVTQSLIVPDCCPNYTVELTATCKTNTDNEIRVIIYDPSGNPANTIIENIMFERIDGTSFCEYENVIVNQQNSPTGVIVNNICAGSYNVTVNTTLSIGCVIGNTITIDCTCVDCTPNPLDNCCGELRVVNSQNMNVWCTPNGCGNTANGANCGGSLNTYSESWIIDTNNTDYQGLFSIQFVPSAIPDKITVKHNGEIIAQSPAVGFWNNTFCDTDDVYGFWTNGTYNSGNNTVAPPTGAYLGEPWIYDANTNPGVSGIDKWFENANTTICDIPEGLACANYELGMKDRRGAGELFFRLLPSGATDTLTIEIQFNPNCTQCTQDCTPLCPFCDRMHINGSSFFALDMPTGSCAIGNGCYPTASCTSLLKSSSLQSLLTTYPASEVNDSIKRYDNDGNSYVNSYLYNCYENGNATCNPQPEYPQGYVPQCDGAYVGNVGKLSLSSGTKYRVKAYNTPACSTIDCEISYKYFNVYSSGDYQFSWANEDNVLPEQNTTTSIYVPEGSGINLAGTYVYEASTNSFLAVSGSTMSNMFVLNYPNGITGSTQYQGFYSLNGLGQYIPLFLNYPGDYYFQTLLGTIQSGPSPFCYDVTGTSIGSAPNTCIDINMNDVNWCKNIIYSASDTIITGTISNYDNCTLRGFTLQGLPSFTALDNSDIWVSGKFGINGSVIMATGSYVVTATAYCDLCTTTGTFIINIVEQQCNITADVVNASCGLSDGSITISTDCLDTSILWTGSSNIAGSTSYVVSGLSEGTYAYILYTSDGCYILGANYVANPDSPTFDIFSKEIECSIFVTGTQIEATGIVTVSSNYVTVNIYEDTGSSLILLSTYNNYDINPSGLFISPDYYPTGNYSVQIIDEGNNCSRTKIMNISNQVPDVFNPFLSSIQCINNDYFIMYELYPTANYEIWYSDEDINCTNFLASGLQVTGTYIDPVGGISYIKQSINISSTGVYTVCLYNIDTNCCNCKEVIVSGELSLPNTLYYDDIESCYGKSILIQKSGMCGAGNDIYSLEMDLFGSTVNLLAYNGLVNDVKFTQVFNGISIGGMYGPTAAYLPSGVYTISGRCIDNECISDYSTFTITVNPLPSQNTEICKLGLGGDCDGLYGTCNSINLTVNPYLNVDHVQWSYNLVGYPSIPLSTTGTTLNLVLGNNLGFVSSIYNVKAKVYNEYGCFVNASAIVEHYPKPYITNLDDLVYCAYLVPPFFATPLAINLAQSSNIFVNGASLAFLQAVGYTFQWKTNLMGAYTNSPIITVPNQSVTSYSVRVTSPEGCVTTGMASLISVSGDPYVSPFSTEFTYYCASESVQICSGIFLPPAALNGYTFDIQINGFPVTVVTQTSPCYDIYPVYPGDYIYVKTSINYVSAQMCMDLTTEDDYTVPIDLITVNTYGEFNICATYQDTNQGLINILNTVYNGPINYVTINSDNQDIIQNYPGKVPVYVPIYHTNVTGTVNVTAMTYVNFNDYCGVPAYFTININAFEFEVQNIVYGMPVSAALVSYDNSINLSDIHYFPLVSATTCYTEINAYNGLKCCMNLSPIDDITIDNSGDVILDPGTYYMYVTDGVCCMAKQFNVMGIILRDARLFNVVSSGVVTAEVSGETVNEIQYGKVYKPTEETIVNYIDYHSPLPFYYTVGPDSTPESPTRENWYNFLGHMPQGGWSGGVWNHSNELYRNYVCETIKYRGVEISAVIQLEEYSQDDVYNVYINIFLNDYYSLTITNKYYTDYNYIDVLNNPKGCFGSMIKYYPVSGSNSLKSYYSVSLDPERINFNGYNQTQILDFLLFEFNKASSIAGLGRGNYTIEMIVEKNGDLLVSGQMPLQMNECGMEQRMFQPIFVYDYSFYGYYGDRALWIDQKYAYTARFWKIYTTGATGIEDFIVSGELNVIDNTDEFVHGVWRSCLMPNLNGDDISCRYIDGIKKYYINLESLGLNDNQEYDIIFESKENLEYYPKQTPLYWPTDSFENLTSPEIDISCTDCLESNDNCYKYIFYTYLGEDLSIFGYTLSSTGEYKVVTYSDYPVNEFTTSYSTVTGLAKWVGCKSETDIVVLSGLTYINPSGIDFVEFDYRSIDFNNSVAQRWGFRFNFGTAYNNMTVENIFRADGIIQYENATGECSLKFKCKKNGMHKLHNSLGVGYVTVSGSPGTYIEFDDFSDILIPPGHALKLYKHYDGLVGMMGSGVGLGTVNTNIINSQHPLITTYVELFHSDKPLSLYDSMHKKGIKYVLKDYLANESSTYYKWYIHQGIKWTDFLPVIGFGASTAIGLSSQAIGNAIQPGNQDVNLAQWWTGVTPESNNMMYVEQQNSSQNIKTIDNLTVVDFTTNNEPFCVNVYDLSPEQQLIAQQTGVLPSPIGDLYFYKPSELVNVPFKPTSSSGWAVVFVPNNEQFMYFNTQSVLEYYNRIMTPGSPFENSVFSPFSTFNGLANSYNPNNIKAYLESNVTFFIDTSTAFRAVDNTPFIAGTDPLQMMIYEYNCGTECITSPESYFLNVYVPHISGPVPGYYTNVYPYSIDAPIESYSNDSLMTHLYGNINYNNSAIINSYLVDNDTLVANSLIASTNTNDSNFAVSTIDTFIGYAPPFIQAGWAVFQTLDNIIDALQDKYVDINLTCCRSDFDN